MARSAGSATIGNSGMPTSMLATPIGTCANHLKNLALSSIA